MKTNDLFVYVEGNTDKLFVEFILRKCFSNFTPRILKYAESLNKDINSLIEKNKNNNEYHVMLVDKNSDSIENKIQKRNKEFSISKDRIIIVNKCIESWYISGSKINYKNQFIKNTKDINKEKFIELTGGTRRNSEKKSLEILKTFDVEKAKQHNESFKHFYENLISIAKQ